MACKTVKVLETTKNTVRLDDFEENKKYDIQVKVGAKGIGLYDVAASLSFTTLGENLMRLFSLFVSNTSFMNQGHSNCTAPFL